MIFSSELLPPFHNIYLTITILAVQQNMSKTAENIVRESESKNDIITS
jgi:hypothetical protein